MKFFAVLAALLLAASAVVAQTNISAVVTNDILANGYLQIQEQLHATRLAIEESRASAAAEADKNVAALNARIASLEKVIADQRNADTDSARKSQQLTLLLAGAFGLAGLGLILVMVYFQWRAFSQIAQISGQYHAALSAGNTVHQLAAPGRTTVELSNARLLDVVGQLEKKIILLEGNGANGHLPEAANGKTQDISTEAQKLMDANQAQPALDLLEKFLASHPNHSEALVKKATALEKLGRDDDALNCYNRALETDGSLVVAHLHKGGLLNRLRRYDEALNCYEAALLAQEKKPKS
jgi:tetratricopeptide (TPR) repeat protein